MPRLEDHQIMNKILVLFQVDQAFAVLGQSGERCGAAFQGVDLAMATLALTLPQALTAFLPQRNRVAHCVVLQVLHLLGQINAAAGTFILCHHGTD